MTSLLFDIPDLPGRPLCAETDPEAFFPETGHTGRDAKAVCAACPVRVQCLQWALARDERWGIWGGLSEKERRQLRNQTRERKQQPISHGTESGYKQHRRRGEQPCHACVEGNRVKRRTAA